MFVERDLNTAVLRNAFFRNIEARHYLDARSQLPAHGHRRLHHFAQLAVHTEAHARHLLVKFKMDVGCARIERIGEGFVDKAGNRAVFRFFVVHIQHTALGRAFLLLFADFLQNGGGALPQPFQKRT